MTTEWQPIETCPKGERVLLLYGDGRTIGAYLTENTAATHWAPLPVMPEPDPMTVVAWHPWQSRPFSGEVDYVYFTPGQPTILMENGGHGNWCPLAPLLDLIPEEKSSDG